jgi:hypothetical protein
VRRNSLAVPYPPRFVWSWMNVRIDSGKEIFKLRIEPPVRQALFDPAIKWHILPPDSHVLSSAVLLLFSG